MAIDKKVIPLAIGGLGIGTTEFTIMGLLPDIAETLRINIPEAGHLISAYALGVVIGAPLLIGVSVKYPPKKILIGLMILFTVFNSLSAAVSNYHAMLFTRFLSGLPHGAFFGVGTVVATRLAPKGREAMYIALMFTGLTVANLAMVPLVTYIGHTFNWRWYFGIVGFIGLIAILFLHVWLPSLPRKENTGFLSELGFLKHSQSWLVLLITAIGFGGLFTWLSYINPLMTHVTGIQNSNMALVMVLVGAGMVVGNLLGGYLSDKIGASQSSVLLLFLMMSTLVGVFLFSEYTVPALVLTFLCGAFSMSISSPINVLMIKAAPNSEMMGAACMQAAFNIANAIGAFLGGLPLLYGYGFTYPALVGVGMSGIGMLIAVIYMLRYKNNTAGNLEYIPVNK